MHCWYELSENLQVPSLIEELALVKETLGDLLNFSEIQI
jgi:hypothetical protein